VDKFFVSISPTTSHLPLPHVAGLGVTFRARSRGLAGPAMPPPLVVAGLRRWGEDTAGTHDPPSNGSD
jgi:hypothetical protein